ncbi:MAG TPA: cytochrome c [Xanthobacteraceae bacterium]|jgi:cytochrome c55X
MNRHRDAAVILATGVVALLILVIVCGRDAGAADPLDPAKLGELVRHDCGSCHGFTLRGGLGKPLTVDRLAQWDSDQLTQVILDGVPGTPMPPWRPLLSESEARWIADHLKSGTLP